MSSPKLPPPKGVGTPRSPPAKAPPGPKPADVTRGFPIRGSDQRRNQTKREDTGGEGETNGKDENLKEETNKTRWLLDGFRMCGVCVPTILLDAKEYPQAKVDSPEPLGTS